ncbi:MAG: MFS transporter [Chloroflexia bacterium]
MEGWRFIVLHRTLLVTIAHLAIANSIYLVLATLGPAYVEIVLKIRVADLGVLIAPAGICTLLGFITMGRFARQDNRNTMIHYGLMGIGFSIMGLALIEPATRSLTDLTGLPVPLTTVTVLAVLISMNFGYWTAFVSVPAQTVLQENSPDEIRGRVLSTFFTVSNAVSFFPILLAGAIADWLGVLETMITIGIFILAIGALSHFSYVRAGRTWEPTPTGRSLAPDH